VFAACRSHVPASSASSPLADDAGDAESPPPAPKTIAVEDAGLPVVAVADAAPPPEPTGPADMALVKGGKFKMGTDDEGELDERPAHEVTVASFWLDKTEVTQKAYDECVSASACTPADPEILATFGTVESGGPFRGPERPVVGLQWPAARTYCAWRQKRLPREAEFERAVRGDDGRKYPWGNEPPTKERTVFYPSNYPEDVGTHPTGRGPYGHDDLAGNVWEWLEDDYDPIAYTRSTADGRAAGCDEILVAQNKLRAEGKHGFTGTNPIPTECEKSIRGGAYNYGASGLRSTNRVHHHARFKLRMLGFRCAKDAT